MEEKTDNVTIGSVWESRDPREKDRPFGKKPRRVVVVACGIAAVSCLSVKDGIVRKTTISRDSFGARNQRGFNRLPDEEFPEELVKVQGESGFVVVKIKRKG